MTFSGSFSDLFIILFGLCPAGLYLPCNTWPEPGWHCYSWDFCKPKEHRRVIAMSYRWRSCLYIPAMFTGMQKQGVAHPRVSWESNDSLLSPRCFFSSVWLLLPHKKGILWSHCKISAGTLRSLTCHSMMILRTEINKRHTTATSHQYHWVRGG